MISNGYIKRGQLTDKYYEDKANGEIKVSEEVADSVASIVEIIDSVYDEKSSAPENARKNNVELKVDSNKLAMPEFKALWQKITSKSVCFCGHKERITGLISLFIDKFRVNCIVQ